MIEKLDEYLELEERLQELQLQDPFPDMAVTALMDEMDAVWRGLTDEEHKFLNERK